MYKRMLVPLDGSRLAEMVFTYAAEFAVRLNVVPTLVHVCRQEELELLPMHKAYIESAAKVIELGLIDMIDRQGSSITIGELKPKVELLTGKPAHTILQYVDENDIDLIIMSTRGRSGVKRWAMGGGADRILHEANIPTLLIKSDTSEAPIEDSLPRRTLIVPLDGSEVGELVLSHVETLANQMGKDDVDIVLLKVCEPPDIMSPVSYYATPDTYPPERPVTHRRYVEKETAKCEMLGLQYLGDIEGNLKERGLSVKSEVLIGKAADEIVRYADTIPYSIVVMAAHSRSELSRRVYGGVAWKVLLGSSRPTFIMRPQ
ncbi:MAG: universal stress protein [Chloroflexota bacterium]|nr:universal stress protein [Chloroflexota bacterium]